MTSPAETPRPDNRIAYPVVTSDWFVDHADGRTLAECVGGSGDDCIANARRIAACLNSCRDIGTEDLEQIAALGEYYRNFGLQMLGSAAATAAFNNSGSAAREG